MGTNIGNVTVPVISCLPPAPYCTRRCGGILLLLPASHYWTRVQGVLRYTTSTSSHCTRRYYCNYYYCQPHFAPSGVEKWFPRRRSTNQGLHLCSPALSHQAASKVGLSQCPSLGQQEGILLNCGLLVLGLVLQNCNCHCPGSAYRAARHNRM